jgi:hypothetical protein
MLDQESMVASSEHAASLAPTPSSEETRLRDLWADYRQHGNSVCGHCNESSALVAAIRDGSQGYQLVCSCCGWATPWFDLREGEIVMLGLDRFGRHSAR